MKVLLTSPDAIIDSQTKAPFPRIISALEHFHATSDEHGVVIASIHEDSFEGIPDTLFKLHIKAEMRGSPDFIEFVKKQLGIGTADIMVLGAKDYDMYWAANSKLILLNALYAQQNNPAEKLYSEGYGIPIQSAAALTELFARIQTITEPWFYRLDIDPRTTMYSLTNANTINQGKTIQELNDIFKACLKAGNNTYRNEFMIYFLISTYKIVKEFEAVNYWGIYPSSGSNENPDLQFFLDKARQSFKGVCKQPLFFRTAVSEKRHSKSQAWRQNDWCDSQLATIIINPYYKGKLKNKTVCVIDDFSTNGTSCETARNLLEAAGVTRIIFIALGKYGRNFTQYDYSLSGDLYGGGLKFERVSSQARTGTMNASSTIDFVASLRGIIA